MKENEKKIAKCALCFEPHPQPTDLSPSVYPILPCIQLLFPYEGIQFCYRNTGVLANR